MTPEYSTVRDFLGQLIGQRLIEITQHDEEEFVEEGASYIALHFEDGTTVTFDIGDDGAVGVTPP
jgi:hypothetical protein